jgi:hypothetical protein
LVLNVLSVQSKYTEYGGFDGLKRNIHVRKTQHRADNITLSASPASAVDGDRSQTHRLAPTA